MKGQCLKATYNLMDVAICFMYIHQIVLLCVLFSILILYI